MSNNLFVRLKQILPPAPVLVGLVTAHHTEDDTSTVVLPTNEGSFEYAGGVSVGSTIRARGTTVAVGEKAFVRDGVIESRAPSCDEGPTEIEVGVVVASTAALAFTGPITEQAGNVGAAFTLDVSGYWSGGFVPLAFTVSAGTLPAGLSLSAVGVISGTPTTEAVTTGVVLRATDTAGHWAESNALAFDVAAPALRMLAQSTTFVLWYSDDAGATWENTGKTFASGVKLVWAGTQWVAAESRTAIDNLWTSPDGIAWTQRNGASSKSRIGLAWNGSTLVTAAPDISSTGVETSSDGVVWTSRDLGLPGWGTINTPSLRWLVDEFVLIYPVSQTQCCRSSDGITWSASIPPKTTSTLQSVSVAAMRVGSQRTLLSLTSPGRFLTTTDFSSFTQRGPISALEQTLDYTSATDGSAWVYGSAAGIFRTTDGLTFSKVVASGQFRSALYRSEGFFVCNSVSETLHSSPDGITWSTVSTMPFNSNGVLASQ